MPGVLVDDPPTDHSTLALPALPHSSLSRLSPFRHYMPVVTRSNIPDFFSDDPPLSQLSPLRRSAGLCLNVSSLPDMYAEDGNSLESSLFLQLSPAAGGQWGCNSTSPTTLSALSALRQFLPSNFDEIDGGNVSETDTYSCDEFRMYEFKVRRCMRGRSHDWTECPFAHPGEKARRRDPRRFHYSGTACADFRRGSCKKGDACEYAHGVFECWLHPARYRTQPCKDGPGCRRRICFFAHTPDQLRIVSPTSGLSSPTSLHFCSADAFESCGSCSPSCSPVSKASSESCKSRLTSTSPLCRMTMESAPDVCFASSLSLASSATLSPSASSLSSSPTAHVNWSPRGVSAFMLPAPAMQLPLHSHSSLSSVPAYHGQWERLNQALSLSTPQSQNGVKTASPLSMPTSTTASTATVTTQPAEDVMGLTKQADATLEEIKWQAAESQSASLFDGNSLLWQDARSEPEMLKVISCTRASEEKMLIERFCSEEEEGEPKLERVESGKGLRAQIFQSLLRSVNQPSC